MTEPIEPKKVRDALPAPIPSDPPQIFDDKCVALAGWYQGFISDLNQATTDTNQNARAAFEFAALVEQLWGQVRDGVITVQDALAAIQAGPVVSVMGRSGVVTGLVDAASPMRGPSALMSDAPLGQPTLYESSTGAGVDWPTTYPVAAWVVQTTGISSRKRQVATQIFLTPQQGWTFERQLHDATWSHWRRVFNDGSVIDRLNYVRNVSGPITIDPATWGGGYYYLNGNTQFMIHPPRAGGEQFKLVIGNGGASGITFSANVKPPVGGFQMPPAGQMITLTFYAFTADLDLWAMYVGTRHSLS